MGMDRAGSNEKNPPPAGVRERRGIRGRKPPSPRGTDGAVSRGMADFNDNVVAYVGGACVHTQGRKVANGSCSVYVGTPQYKLARKTDPTTGGHIVNTGIPDIMSS